jgi:alkylmercury lyase-like protein
VADLARFTGGSIADRQAALSGPLRGLHRAVLRRFLGGGTPIEVTVRGGAWTWSPAGTVVVAARAADCGTGGGSSEVMCPHTAFHASRSSARAWLAARGGLDAEILDQETAVECGRLNFGTLLTGPP